MGRHTPLCIFIAICFFYQLSVTEGSGLLRVKFIQFVNPRGEGNNGHCCDGRWKACQSNGCDHKFIVCVDESRSSDDYSTNSCLYGRRQSQELSNSNTNNFGTDMGGVRNPMEFDLRTIPSDFSIKVHVVDDDGAGNDDDYVDFLRLDVMRPNYFQPPGQWRNETVTRRTTLYAAVSYQCDPQYYTDRCDTFCKTPGYNDHYSCDQQTGRRVCERGWTGSRCNQRDW